MQLPKRRDREPGPVAQASMQPNPSHIVPNATANSTVTDSQGNTHPGIPGFAMHGFPSFSPPAFPLQNYPMPNLNYHIPTPMYAPPYSYPFAPQGAQVMQPHAYPAPPFLMQNYPTYPLSAPMYPPPSTAPGYPSPFTMPAPQDINFKLSYGQGRERQYSMSSPQPKVDDVIVPNLNSEMTLCDWINSDPPADTPEP